MGVWGIWDGGVVDVMWNSEGRGLLWRSEANGRSPLRGACCSFWDVWF